MASQNPRQPENAQKNGKRAFEPPKLIVYGDIVALTRKVGRTGRADGGKNPNNKTRP